MRERVTLPNKEKTKVRVTYCRTRRKLKYHRSRRRRVTHYRARGRRVTYYRTKARMVIYYRIRTRMDATPGKKGSLPFILRISPSKLSNQEFWNLSCASKHIFLLVIYLHERGGTGSASLSIPPSFISIKFHPFPDAALLLLHLLDCRGQDELTLRQERADSSLRAHARRPACARGRV